MEENNLGLSGSGADNYPVVPREKPRGLDRRSRFRRISAERRIRRPWVADLADRRTGRDRRGGHRRSGLDRRSLILHPRDGGLAMQAMAFLARQTESWIEAAFVVAGSAVRVCSNPLA